MSLSPGGSTAEVLGVVITDNDDSSQGEGTEDPLVTKDEKLQYTVTQIPPIPLMIGAALQHVLICLPACLATSFIVADVLCAAPDSPIRPKLFSSTLFMSGICTVSQTLLGLRLPVFQGPSSSFLPVLLALQNDIEWSCDYKSTGGDGMGSVNNTVITEFNMSHNATIFAETEKLQKLSGSLMAASLVEIVVGATGVVGFLLRYIGPITVAPTISLVGFSLYKIPILYSRSSWEIALIGAVTVIVFSLFLENIQIPFPSCGRTTKERKTGRVRLFGLFPLLLSIMLMWTICALLTVTNVFPDDRSNIRYMARTDAKSSLIHLTPWLIFPYPGQFGMPGFSFAVFVGFSTAFFSSFVESVGDYFAGAKACEVDIPPNHAVNRGILMEGLGGLLSGAVGVGHATTSYSGNIATISVTKTGSRSVMVCAGMILVIFAFLGKFGAALASVPDPVLGGVIIIICGLLVSIGFSTLRYVNLRSSRNLTILGLSFFVGVFLPEWIDRHPDVINTGNTEADAVLKVTLGTHMFVGGMVAMILDNIVKGTLEDRGIAMWRKRHENDCNLPEENDGSNLIPSSVAYGWNCVPSLYKKINILSYLPFMPPNPRRGPIDSAVDKDIL